MAAPSDRQGFAQIICSIVFSFSSLRPYGFDLRLFVVLVERGPAGPSSLVLPLGLQLASWLCWSACVPDPWSLFQLALSCMAVALYAASLGLAQSSWLWRLSSGCLWLALHALACAAWACPSVLPWGSVVASLFHGGPVSLLMKFALLFVVLGLFVVYSLVVAPALDLCSQLRCCLW